MVRKGFRRYRTIVFSDIGQFQSSDPEVVKKCERMANEYLSQFAINLERRGDCICCGFQTGGVISNLKMGLQRGEAECGNCRWPYRTIHEIDVGTGVTLKIPFKALPYLPKEDEEDAEAEAVEAEV